jgi:hypothetical protein
MKFQFHPPAPKTLSNTSKRIKNSLLIQFLHSTTDLRQLLQPAARTVMCIVLSITYFEVLKISHDYFKRCDVLRTFSYIKYVYRQQKHNVTPEITLNVYLNILPLAVVHHLVSTSCDRVQECIHANAQLA